VWSGALATAGNEVFYGTLEGYLKAVDAKTGKELYKFKTPSGIIGNVMTYEHGAELKWRYGYFLVIAVIAAICSSLYWRFHRNGWV
jgi:hypothetical protein